METKIVKVAKNIARESYDYFIPETYELIGRIEINGSHEHGRFYAWYEVEYNDGEENSFEDGKFASKFDAADFVEEGIKERYTQQGLSVRFNAYGL